MRTTRPAIAGIAIALLVPLLSIAPASAGPPPPTPVESARAWLVAQQQADGGFELASFPGFETPDAVLAIATAAQTGSTWSTAEALAAVEAVDVGGVTALDWADEFVDGGVSAGLEAKVALLVALPLGLDPSNFDPGENGASDLTDALDAISPGLFNSFLTARILDPLLGRNVHQNDLQAICEAQHTDGGWSFDAVPDGVNFDDADTSGFATMALRAAGVPTGDTVMVAASGLFLALQDGSGGWRQASSPFGSGPPPLDPNSTALASIGIVATGGDPTGLAASPAAFLEGLQVTTPGSAPDDVVGRIASPNDGFGANTFATSQTIQALALLAGSPTWLPLSGAGDRECLGAHPFDDVAPTAWNDNALRWLHRFSMADGYPDGSFRPLEVFNRAQASRWFDNFFPGVAGAPHGFTDVAPWFTSGANFVGDPAWPGGAIAAGFPNGEFRGTAPFNRGQAILWMWKAAGRPVVAQPHGFTDGAPWFDEALDWATFHGIVSGFADNTFRPGDQINRGQGASWFYNLAATPEAWGPAITLPATIVHTAPPA